MHQKKYEESLLYSQKVGSFATDLSRKDMKIIALKLITEEESIESKANSHLHIGVSYVGLNKPSEAIHMLTIAKEIAKKGGFLKLEMYAHESLAKAYELKGDLKKTIEEHKKYMLLRNSYLSTL